MSTVFSFKLSAIKDQPQTLTPTLCVLNTYIWASHAHSLLFICKSSSLVLHYAAFNVQVGYLLFVDVWYSAVSSEMLMCVIVCCLQVDSIRKLCKLLMIGERGNGEAVTTVKDSPCMIIEVSCNILTKVGACEEFC